MIKHQVFLNNQVKSTYLYHFLYNMSRPPQNHNNYNPANIVNGGLIDFTDARALAEQQQQQQFFNHAQAIANMNAYTMQQSMMNPLGNPTPMNAPFVYNGVPPHMQSMMGSQQGFLPPTPSFLPVNNTTNSQVVPGPPSEIYVHGKVYKAYDEPVVKALEVGATAKPVENELKKHVDQKVAEFMSKDNSSHLSTSVSTPTKAGSNVDDTKELFLRELKKLNSQLNNQMKKKGSKP